MKRYIAVLEIDDDEEIVCDANISYTYRSNGTNYETDESVELKAEDEWQRMKTYEDGLKEAWELVRDIIALPNSKNKSLEMVRYNAFADDALLDIIRNHSASEVIKKIKEYEEIKVGDELSTNDVNNNFCVVVGDLINGADYHVMRLLYSDGSLGEYEYRKVYTEFKKTGRHFPQIAEVLKQMKEGEE